MNIHQNNSYRFFDRVIKSGKISTTVAIMMTIAMAWFIPDIRIDTSVEAFIHPEHPSLVSRNNLKEIFGLSDPIIVAIESKGPDGIYNKETLSLIQMLTDTIQLIPGVDPERVVSLSTENNIYGNEEGMIIESFIEDIEDGKELRNAVEAFPLYVGNLVSEDGTVSLIVVELLNKKQYGADVYDRLQQLTAALNTSEKIFIAGEGAVVEQLGKYVQDDAKLMTPMAFLVITIILFLAYRTWGGLLLSNLVVIGSLIITMGIMVYLDTPFYLISNIIPVIIIAISVADSIHILGHFYELKSRKSSASAKVLTIETMMEMWRPILVTSITNIVGFIAMGYSSSMPPMRAVGLYSSIGVVFALLLSIFVLPVLMANVKLKPSRAFSQGNQNVGSPDVFGRSIEKLGCLVLKTPSITIATSILIAILGIIGIGKMELNDTMVEYFNPKENIYLADQLINQKLNGTNFFDIIIETDDTEGLFNVSRLKKIEELQTYLHTQAHVKGTTSIVDILKQINMSIHGGTQDAYTLPDNDDLIAQYFLLYSSSSSPADFEQYVDYDYRLANIRVSMDNGQYKYVKDVLKNTRSYLASEFEEPGMQAEISGWLNVINYWIGSLSYSHFLGVILAMLIVLVITSISFRSLYAGLLAVIPVAVAVFLNYAIMGFTGIWLKVSTSITVAIAIGVAVDFSVHTIDRMIVLTKGKGYSINRALFALYPNTGRALLFNLLALALGFGTNMMSAVPPWATFGLLVMTMVSVSFVASLTLLPALIKVLKPKFLHANKQIIEKGMMPVNQVA
jgi:predicted RND superfamily exporter protein